MWVCCAVQATSTEVWTYRNQKTKEAVISFRGTSNPQDMMTDAALAMSAFSPGHREGSKPPHEVAAELSDEELMEGPLGGLFRGIKVPCIISFHSSWCLLPDSDSMFWDSTFEERYTGKLLAGGCSLTNSPRHRLFTHVVQDLLITCSMSFLVSSWPTCAAEHGGGAAAQAAVWEREEEGRRHAAAQGGAGHEAVGQGTVGDAVRRGARRDLGARGLQ